MPRQSDCSATLGYGAQKDRHENVNSSLHSSGASAATYNQVEENVVAPSAGFHELLRRTADFEDQKGEFLRSCGADYGYGDQLDQVRRQEFRRLNGQVYLDYAGTALYSELHIKESAEELMGQLMCNPHSAPTSSSADALAALRRETLELLNADGRQYDVVITSGATAALNLVATCFPWSSDVSCFAHPAAVHNSVLGMRGPALAAGAAVRLVQLVAEQEGTEAGCDAGWREPCLRTKAAAAAQTAGTPPAAGAAKTAAAAAEGSCGEGRRRRPCRAVPVGQPIFPAARASVNESGSSASGVGAALAGCSGAGGGANSSLSTAADGGSSEGCPSVGGGCQSGITAGRTRGRVASSAAAVTPSHHHHLLALPVECNFTGDREDLSAVVQHVRQYGLDIAAAQEGAAAEEQQQRWRHGGGGRWWVLLDAAKACATAPPDLSRVPADFVVLSYYKIFGHPTGLGALVVRKEALALLAASKSYFGGGTVEVAVADRPYHVRRPGPSGLEDGTPPFTAVAAARPGFAFLRRLGGLPAIHRHARCLARWLAGRLTALRHANGAPVCVLYGRWPAAAAAAAAAGNSSNSGHESAPDPQPALVSEPVDIPDHGPTLAFNLRRPDGGWVGYAEVGRLAAMHGLHLRTGCFCNPGACAEWLGLSAEDVIRHHSAGHVCWDDHDLVDGRPTGAVRVSLGAVSSFADVYALLELVRRYFVDEEQQQAHGQEQGQRGGRQQQQQQQQQQAAAQARTCCTVATSSNSNITTMAAASSSKAAVEAGQLQAVETVAEGEAVKARAAARGEGAQLEGAAAPAPAAPAPAAEGSAPQQLLPIAERLEARPLPCQELGDGVSGNPKVCLRGSGGAAAPPSASTPAAAAPGAVGVAPGLGAADAAGCSAPPDGGPTGGVVGRLTGILLYPVKSCAPQAAEAWPVGPTGLLYDREWALVDDSGKVVTLKQCPRMALIRPVVDLTHGTLTIHAPGGADVAPLQLAIPGLFRGTGGGAVWGTKGPAETSEAAGAATSAPVYSGTEDVQRGVRRDAGAVRLDAGLTTERVQVCGDTVCTDLVDACHDTEGETRVRDWFSRVLGAPCRIVQQRTGARKVRRPGGQRPAAATAAAGAAAAGAAAAAPPPPPQGGVVPEGNRPSGDAAGGRDGGGAVEAAVGFANDGQYLLVTEASMADLRNRMAAAASHHSDSRGLLETGHPARGAADADAAAPIQKDDHDLLTRFRPNLVVAGFEPYDEDGWAAVRVGPLVANVLGTCPRCELLQVDPRVGVRRGAEVLVALAQYRRRGGRVQFGVLLAAEAANPAGPAEPRPAPGAETETAMEAVDVVVPQDKTGAWAGWLRCRFGPTAVVAVGDVVVPRSAAV